MRNYRDIEELKKALRETNLYGLTRRISLHPSPEPVESIDTLEEVYWVEAVNYNPWILVRGRTALMLFCPNWFENENVMVYPVRCARHGRHVDVVPIFPRNWPCTCEEHL